MKFVLLNEDEYTELTKYKHIYNGLREWLAEKSTEATDGTVKYIDLLKSLQDGTKFQKELIKRGISKTLIDKFDVD